MSVCGVINRGYKQTNVAGEAPFDVPVIQRGRLPLEL